MPLATRGYGVGLAPSNLTVIGTSVGVFDENGFEIGFIQSISRDDNRSTTKVRHLNKADAGRIIEQQPGVEEYSLSITGWGMYQKSDTNKQSLLNRLPVGSGVFQTMNQQFIPFAIREEQTHPATGATNVTLFLGCMIVRFSEPVNIGTTAVTQSATVTPSWVE